MNPNLWLAASLALIGLMCLSLVASILLRNRRIASTLEISGFVLGLSAIAVMTVGMFLGILLDTGLA